MFHTAGVEKLCDVFPAVERGDYLLDEVATEMKIAMHAFAFKTSLLKDNGIAITENCFYTDNEIALLPLPYATTMRIEHFPVYRYGLELAGQSVSVEGARKHYQDIYKVFDKLFAVYDKDEFQTPQKKETFRYNLAIVASSCYELAFLQEVSWSNWKQLVAFDRNLKKNPELYNVDVNLKKTVAFRKSRYLLYPICAWKAARSFEG